MDNLGRVTRFQNLRPRRGDSAGLEPQKAVGTSKRRAKPRDDEFAQILLCIAVIALVLAVVVG